MALNLVSPGVQIREVDLTVGAITAANDQVGAFVAPFAKGPVNEPILVTNEAELLGTFGKPSETDGQNEYWLSASNYLSYGGVMRVVRATGDTLNNANSDAQSSLQILNDEDYETNHRADTAWEYAARTPGSWANDLKVCTIDGMADQIITGIGTTARTVTTSTTVATKTGDVGITTNLITGITTSSLTVADIVSNANIPEGTTISSIGVSQIILSDNSTNTGSLTAESFVFSQESTSTVATDVQVGYAVTQTLNASYAENGVVRNFVGEIRGIITGIGNEEIYVKVVDRTNSFNGVTEAIEYKNPGQGANANSFEVDDGNTVNIVTSAGIVTNTFANTQAKDWYDNQTLGLDNQLIYWKSIAPKPGTSQYAEDRSAKNDQLHIVVVDDTGKVSGTAGAILEKYTFLSKASDARISPTQGIYYKDYLASNSDNIFAGVARATTASSLTGVTGTSTFTVDNGVWGTEAQGKSFNVSGNETYKFTSGVDYSSANGMAPELGDVVAGYEIFRNPAEYDIDYLIMGPSGGTSIFESQAKATALMSIADERKDCMAVISPHKSDIVAQSNTNTQTDKVIEFFEPLPSSSYAVFDSGYKYTFDRFNNKFVYLALNSDVAGLMARTSADDFAWFSPAGANRGAINNAVKLAFNPSKAQRDLLYSKRINPVIASSGQGILLFGDKTALGYASAFDRINVRKLFLALESSIEGAARAQLFEFNDATTRTNFINIVEPYLRDVKGKRGITEFIVVCDDTNNTPDVIDANQFKADIFVKPARSINFIGLTFVATRTGVSFSEVVGTV
tara:strand:- start:1481 stop:3868 length:2388 start_codon:yes stop_codon:yes gene_type:complete